MFVVYRFVVMIQRKEQRVMVPMVHPCSEAAKQCLWFMLMIDRLKWFCKCLSQRNIFTTLQGPSSETDTDGIVTSFLLIGLWIRLLWSGAQLQCRSQMFFMFSILDQLFLPLIVIDHVCDWMNTFVLRMRFDRILGIKPKNSRLSYWLFLDLY